VETDHQSRAHSQRPIRRSTKSQLAAARHGVACHLHVHQHRSGGRVWIRRRSRETSMQAAQWPLAAVPAPFFGCSPASSSSLSDLLFPLACC
jgi:hypothetical protein